MALNHQVAGSMPASPANLEMNMAHVKKGHLVRAPEWWKHLRWVKRVFWKRHRQAEKTEIRRSGKI
jgi:hypothetical protein